MKLVLENSGQIFVRGGRGVPKLFETKFCGENWEKNLFFGFFDFLMVLEFLNIGRWGGFGGIFISISLRI